MADTLTTTEAAALSRYAESSLRAMRLRGKGPPFIQPEGPRGKVLYPKAEFERWLAGRGV